jgi:hypothetical protein
MKGRLMLPIVAVVAPIAFVGIVVLAPIAFLTPNGVLTLVRMPLVPLLWVIVPTWVVAQIGAIMIIRREQKLVQWLRGQGYGSDDNN